MMMKLIPQTHKLWHRGWQTLDEVTPEVEDCQGGEGSDGEGEMEEGIVPDIMGEYSSKCADWGW